MKKLILILILTPALLFAAPTVEIVDLNNVKVDGVNQGSLTNLLSNSTGAQIRAAAAPLQAALATYLRAKEDAATAALAAQAKAEARCQAIITKLRDAAATKEQAAAEAEKTELERKREALIAEQQRLAAEAAAKQAEIDALPQQ